MRYQVWNTSHKLGHQFFTMVYPVCWSGKYTLIDSTVPHSMLQNGWWKKGLCFLVDYLVGLVVRRPPRERKIPGSNPTCAGIFSGSSHTSDLKTGTPVATLPGTWRFTDRVSTGTGRPGVSILWPDEVESLICSFNLSVAARRIVWGDPSLRYTSLLLGR